MTDQALPGRQRVARWSSGQPTLAASGATWLRGSRWGEWEGALAVAALKDGSLTMMRFDGPARRHHRGPVRGVRTAAGGADTCRTPGARRRRGVRRTVPGEPLVPLGDAREAAPNARAGAPGTPEAGVG